MLAAFPMVSILGGSIVFLEALKVETRLVFPSLVAYVHTYDGITTSSYCLGTYVFNYACLLTST